MSQNTRKEVLAKLRGRYAGAGLEHKKKLLDQAVELMGCHRKSASRALRPNAVAPGKSKLLVRIGRPRCYEPEQMLPVLKVIWLVGQQPCGRRLASMMPEPKRPVWPPPHRATTFPAPRQTNTRPPNGWNSSADTGVEWKIRNHWRRQAIMAEDRSRSRNPHQTNRFLNFVSAPGQPNASTSFTHTALTTKDPAIARTAAMAARRDLAT